MRFSFSWASGQLNNSNRFTLDGFCLRLVLKSVLVTSGYDKVSSEARGSHNHGHILDPHHRFQIFRVTVHTSSEVVKDYGVPTPPRVDTDP